MSKRKNPMAPAVPKTKPETRPAPPTPTPARPRPYTAPKPVVTPRPKLADYEEHASSHLVNFWDNIPQDHGFFLHPILFVHGDELSRAAFKYVFDRIERMGIAPGDIGPHAGHLAARAVEVERGHEGELTDIARAVTEAIWNIPPDQLKGGLGNVQGEVGASDLGTGDEWVEGIDENTRKEIEKRILLNTLIQGAAVQAMFDTTRLVTRELNTILPGITSVYDQFSLCAVGTYWSVDYAAMGAQVAKLATGYEHVRYEKREDEEVPVVYAKAVIWPVLVQEFVKGVMESICIHGYSSLDPVLQAIVIDKADKIEYEALEIIVGPELWRRVASRIKSDTHVADAVMTLAQMPPDALFAVVEAAIRGKK